MRRWGGSRLRSASRKNGRPATRVAPEREGGVGEDDLTAGAVAVEDGQPGVPEQEVRQRASCPPTESPTATNPAAQAVISNWRVGSPARCGPPRFDRVEQDSPDKPPRVRRSDRSDPVR